MHEKKIERLGIGKIQERSVLHKGLFNKSETIPAFKTS